MFKHAVTRLKPQVSASSMLQICSELKEMTLLASRLLRLAFFLGSFNHVWGACFKLNVRSQSFFLLDSRLCRFKTLSFLVRQGVQFYCFCSRMIWFADPLYHHCRKLRHADVFHTSIHITVSLCVIKAPCLLQCHVCWTSFDAPKGQGVFKDSRTINVIHVHHSLALNTPRCCLMAS